MRQRPPRRKRNVDGVVIDWHWLVLFETDEGLGDLFLRLLLNLHLLDLAILLLAESAHPPQIRLNKLDLLLYFVGLKHLGRKLVVGHDCFAAVLQRDLHAPYHVPAILHLLEEDFV